MQVFRGRTNLSINLFLLCYNFSMLNIISVFIGGGLGAVLRYLSSAAAVKYIHLNFPIATLFVNILGGFIIGFLYVYFIDKPQINQDLKLAHTVGFCGGLTTFSTFSLEIFRMITNSQFIHASCYIIASIIICLMATAFGAHLAKFFNIF